MMNRADEALRLFEALDGLDDVLIEEGMLPDESTGPAGVVRARKRPLATLGRMANSGWGVAVICLFVAVGVLAAMIRFGGMDSGSMAPEDVPNNSPGGTQADVATDMNAPDEEPVTDEESETTAPDSSARVPYGKQSVSAEGLLFTSNGDGTCKCVGIKVGSFLDSDHSVLEFPTRSPDGDVVTTISRRAFSTLMDVREVYLPAGLTELDHKAFPMDAPIYRLHGNVLYLGSRENPHMVAVAAADGRPGATSLHPDTKILACHALTYDAGLYFSLAWGDKVAAYEEEAVFVIPSGLIHVGDYALLDVGRPIRYGGYLVGWDTLTAGLRCLGRTVDGEALTVTCLDGETQTVARVRKILNVSTSKAVRDGVLFGEYWETSATYISEDFYAWIKNPDAATEAPAQFAVESAFGEESRVVTYAELQTIGLFCGLSSVTEETAAYLAAFNEDPLSLFAGKTVVALYVNESSMFEHEVVDVQVVDGQIVVTLARYDGMVPEAEGDRFVLVAVDDPTGALQAATVSYKFSPDYLPESARG